VRLYVYLCMFLYVGLVVCMSIESVL